MKTKLLNSMRVLLVAVLLGVGGSAWGQDPEISSDGYVTVYSQDFETENSPTTKYGWDTGDKGVAVSRVHEDGGNYYLQLSGTFNRSLKFDATYTRYDLTFKWYAKLNNTSSSTVQIKFITDHTSTTNKYAYRYNDVGEKMYLSDGNKITDSNKSSFLELTNYTGTTTEPTSVSTDFYTVNVVSDGTNVRFTFTNPAGTAVSRTFTYSGDFALGGIQLQNATSGKSYIDDIVLKAPVNNYTINYKLGDDIIKSEVGAANPGETINASTIPFTEGGQKYFKANDEVVTSWTKTGTDAETFNVSLRVAKSATLLITKNVGGESSVTESTAIEADDGTLPWSYSWSLYEKKSSTGVYYRADEDETFTETGTFTDGETISKTVTYSTAEEDVVFFTEVSATEGSGYVKTDASYSGGTSERFYNSSRSYTIPAIAGCYALEIKVTHLDGTTNRGVTLKVAGTTLAPYATFNVGTHTVPFYMSADNSTLGVSKGYNGTNNIDYIVIRRISSVSKTITSAGWATYCSIYPLDFSSVIANLDDVYIVTGGAGGVLTKTSVTGGTVPANTGLLLKGEGACTIPVVASSSTDVSGNKLVGVTSSTVIAAETGYVLMNDATHGLAFYLNSNAFTVGANTAYLPADFTGGSARMSFFSFDSETTGVNDMNSKMSEARGTYYNLNGQRVEKPAKGLYIVNGKKVLVTDKR